VFNRYIRERDKNETCISCGRVPKKRNAGHYRSVGACPELRFEPLNVNLQCEHCNTFKSGNAIEYRINLVKKIGLERVEWLEGPHEPAKWSIDEIKAIKKEYADKTGVKVYIRIPSLNIAYEYDPIEEKIKRKKLELLKLLLKEKKLKLEIRKPTRADDKITLF
ncbi:MAG: hypothetical protein DSY42_01725, partial [Aquifex sp.]